MPQKKQIKLETEINEIVIVNNKKLTPYIELVNFSSRNIDQKKLGTILGIFEIKDTSDDSAYIVNFLSSVAKKTYFASHQKNPEESFESTLAKVNLSLSEVAKHGNVNWIGKIDAVLCSVFENQINFSVSGDAKVLLLRNGKLTEISADLSPKDEAANPLKTFTDIASGRLEINDKLILTTDDISHIFSLDDLEKYALSFKKDKFLRFLKTALVNELDIAGTIIIDTKKTAVKIKEKNSRKNKDQELDDESNLFGNRAFEETQKSKKTTSVSAALLEEDSSKKEYVHKQTGHIYISDSNEHYEKFHEDKIGQFFDNLKEKFSDFNYWLNENYIKKGTYKLKKKLASLFEKKPPVVKSPTPQDTSFKHTSDIPLNLSEKLKNISSQIKDKTKKLIVPKPVVDTNFNPEEFFAPTPPPAPVQTPPTIKTSSALNKETFFAFTQKTAHQLSVLASFLYSKSKLLMNLAKKTLPHFIKLKRIFLKMSPRMKLLTLAILLVIFVGPLMLFLRDAKPAPAPTENNSANSSEDLTINPSAQSHRDVSTLYENGSLIGTFSFNNVAFAITKDKIVELGEKTRDYTFPENFKNAQYYSFMSDLNLLFLINDKNQIISFSPISLKFRDDSIAIENNAKIEGIGTYLTYLYIVDANNKQIYRYPRADNGFGEKINWLGSDINFENITGMAIDGNLYLTKKDSVVKLFNRKTQDFNLKIDSNSSIDEIFTNEDLTHIYILDNFNGELVKFDKNGNSVSFVSNQDLTKATKIWIDEKNSVAYFTTENSLSKITLP